MNSIPKQPITSDSSSGFVRVIQGLGSTAFGQIITGLQAILLVPLYLSAWGSDAYGRWLALFATSSYLTLIDLGGQNYIANILADAYIKKDENLFRLRLSQGLSFYVIISFLVGLLWSLTLVFPWESLLGDGFRLTQADRIILFCLGISNVISVAGGIYVTVYRSTGKLARGSMLGNLLRLVILLVFIFILFKKLSPIIFAEVTLISSIIVSIIIIWDIRHTIPISKNLSLSMDKVVNGMKYMNNSIYFWILAVAGMINFQGVILVLGSNLQSSEVALYSTHRTVTGLLTYFTILFQTTLWPELTFIHSQNRKRELESFTNLSIRMMVLICGICAIGLWLFLPLIYPLWTSKQLNLNTLLFFILLLQGVLAAGWSTSAWPILASNNPQKMALVSIGNAFLTILLALSLAGKFGVIGVATATLVGDILFGLFMYPVITAKTLAMNTKEIYKSIFFPLIPLLLLSIVVFIFQLVIPKPFALIFSILILLLSVYPMSLFAIGKEHLNWMVSLLHRSGIPIKISF